MEYNQLPTPVPASQALKGAAITIEVPNGARDAAIRAEICRGVSNHGDLVLQRPSRQTCVLNLFSIAVVIALALPSAANSQVWRGTAPFCEGKCLG